MNKQADIAQASDKLRGWYEGMNPDARQAILRGLAGAAVGGLATGGLAAATPHDAADRHPVVSPALMGALMGGAGASLLPIGAKLLGGGIRFESEPKRPAGAKATEAALSPLISHPLAIGGTAAAAYHAREPFGTLIRGVRAQGHGNVLARISKALGSKRHWEAAARGLQPGHGLSLKELAKMPRTFPHAGSKLRLATIPAALAAGAIGDKYLKGEY